MLTVKHGSRHHVLLNHLYPGNVSTRFCWKPFQPKLKMLLVMYARRNSTHQQSNSETDTMKQEILLTNAFLLPHESSWPCTNHFQVLILHYLGHETKEESQWFLLTGSRSKENLQHNHVNPEKYYNSWELIATWCVSNIIIKCPYCTSQWIHVTILIFMRNSGTSMQIPYKVVSLICPAISLRRGKTGELQ